MENNSIPESLTALSPSFTPPSITAHLSPVEKLLEDSKAGVNVYSNHLTGLISPVFSGWSYPDMKQILDYARDGIENGLFDQREIELHIIYPMSDNSSGFREKAQWIQDQGFAIQLSLDSPEKHILAWSATKSEEVFDWAIEKIVQLPDSEVRRAIFNKILINVLAPHNNFTKLPYDITHRTARRIDVIEQACPGLVRELVSSLPNYNSTPSQRKEDNVIYREGSDIRNRLMVFFLHAMVSGLTEHLADWMDPSRYGTPKSVNTMLEAAILSSYQNLSTSDNCRQTWIAISRALGSRSSAKSYWDKQTRPSNHQPVYHSHRPATISFPSQGRVFGSDVIGKDGGRYGVSDNKSPRWDDRLPMNPIGRLLGCKNPVIDTLVQTAAGREKVVDTMMSHPAFMAYGFAMFGQDLLSWEQASKFDGFRDEHGYGAARYALCVCSPVTSSFDVVLHRMLRQYKGLCDEAAPSLESLFISSDARAKFRAMELKKISSKVTRQNEIKRERNSSFKM